MTNTIIFNQTLVNIYIIWQEDETPKDAFYFTINYFYVNTYCQSNY